MTIDIWVFSPSISVGPQPTKSVIWQRTHDTGLLSGVRSLVLLFFDAKALTEGRSALPPLFARSRA